MTSQTTSRTREGWLHEVLKWTSKDIFGCGEAPSLPDNIKVSVGWPSAGGLGKKTRVIGQCWSFEQSDGKFSEIFISPLLGDAQEAVETLVHEAVHATVGVKEKHKGDFARVSRTIGFLPPWTQTPASPELAEKIKDFLGSFEKYPHAAINPKSIEGPAKPQTCRQLKLLCADPSCGYTIRTTRKWIELGMPTCVCGKLFELTDKPEGDE